MKTFAELLEALRRLHILEADQLDALTRQYASKSPDPRQVAKQLVQQGLLTHFQANQLFKGRGAELLLGNYVLLELVGEGGMGAVYKARNWKLGQIVAIKLIRPERLSNEAAIRRFEREIRASAHLHHPNIVRSFDADEVGDTHLLVMEFVPEGRDLNRIVREHGPLPIADACRYARQIALGLQHAHERSLVHRDIKPHNVLISGSGVAAAVPSGGGAGTAAAPGIAKILDFGLALLGESEDSTTLTKEGAVMGTVDYLAPEQARSAHDADIRSDLYSLGCTLYFVLAGRAPFVGGTATEKIYKHQFEEPMPIELVRVEVPPALGNIVRKLMAKRPVDRYQTPVELVADLDAFLAGKPVGASSSSSVRLGTPVPTAAHASAIAAAPARAQATQDTENPFASLSTSSTSADGPVSVRLRQPVAAAPLWRNKTVLLGIAGGAGALFCLVSLIIGAVMVLNRRPTQVAEHHEPLPPPRDKTKTKKERSPGKTETDPVTQPEPPKERTKTPDPAVGKREQAEKQWLAAETKVRAKRTADAEAAYKTLDAAFNHKDVTFASFAKELAAFNSKHGGTPAALRGAELLAKLRSPLDTLDAGKLSDDAKTALLAWQGAADAGLASAPAAGALVAVDGEQRGRHWGTITDVQFVGADDKLVLCAGAGVVQLMAADTRAIVALFPSANVWAVAPDGKRLATASLGGKLQVYDLEASRSLWHHAETFLGGGIRALCFTPDGKTVAAGGGDRRVGFWDAATGTKARDYSADLGAEITSLVYPTGGDVLAALCGSTVQLINPKKPQEPPTVFPSPNGPALFALSPDGKTLAVHFTTKLRLYELATKKELLSVDDLNADASPRSQFSPDGRYFAFREVAGMRIWSLPRCQLIAKWDAHPDGGVATCAFSLDSKQLWTGSGPNSGEIAVWESATGKLLGKRMPGYDEPTRSISDIRMAPAAQGGNLVAWLCGGNNVRLWQRDRNAEQAMIRRPDPGPYAFSADGKRVVTGDLNMVRIWSTQTGLESPPLRGRAPTPAGLTFSPDARLLLAGDTRGVVHRWSLGGTPETDLAQWTVVNNGNAPRVAFLADGQRFITFGEIGNVFRWHLAVENGSTVGPNQYGFCVSPHGRYVLLHPVEGQLSVWDVGAGIAKEVGTTDKYEAETVQLQHIVDAAVTPDERYAVLLHNTNQPRTIRVCSLESGREVFRFPPHNCARIAVSPDGKHLVSTDPEGTVSLFDLHTGTLAGKIDLGRDLAPQPAVFAPDGKRAAFVVRSTVVVIDIPSGNRVKEWPMPGAVGGIAFAPDGRHLAVGNANGSIYVMRLTGDGQAPKQ